MHLSEIILNLQTQEITETLALADSSESHQP